jgi:hypothetical protein
MDAAGYQHALADVAERHGAAFTVTASQNAAVKAAIEALAANPATGWQPAVGAEEERGSEVAETLFRFGRRTCRLIMRRLPRHAGEQLSFDDIEGWHLRAMLTNIPRMFGTATAIE